MRLKINRYSLCIVPEDIKDEVFIEEILHLKNGGDSIPCVRVNAMGLSCIAELEIKVSNNIYERRDNEQTKEVNK